MEPRTLTGQLLVAAPMLSDPNFYRTVVLMLAHSGEGALGVVINRASPTPVDEVLPEWASRTAAPELVFDGGPVRPGAVIGLAAASGEPDGWERAVGNVGTVDLSIGPDELSSEIGPLRFFSGYAGWDAGQLEAELAEDAWFVVDAIEDDVLSPEPGGLWRSVLKRQGGRFQLVADFPPHPSYN